MPSIENRKFQKHILVEWEFDQQPDNNTHFMKTYLKLLSYCCILYHCELFQCKLVV